MALANTFTNYQYSKTKDYVKNADKFQISFIKSLRNRFPFQWYIKRGFDLLSTLLGLMFLFPIMLTIALIVKLDSKGPILFKQKRVGHLGKEFYMYKFRSMEENAENNQVHYAKLNETNSCMFKIFDDPRVTKVGKFLRKYSLDELPQLFNVLKGEMSLVGPRPPIVSELNGYKDWHYIRFAALPGLTGVWQTSGRSTIKDFDKVVSLDLGYINDWNLFLDIKLILKTFPVVLFGRDTA